MTTAAEASFRLDRALLARHAAGQCTHLEQVDCVLCEDGETVMAYVYFSHDPEPFAFCYDWHGGHFDRTRAAEALLYDAAATLH